MDATTRRTISESVESALEALGGTVRESILFYVMRKYDLPKEDIPVRMEEFMKGLRDLLGCGSRLVEKLIISNFANRNAVSVGLLERKTLTEIFSNPQSLASFRKPKRAQGPL